MATLTFEKDIKKEVIRFRVFNKDKFHYDVFKSMEDYIQEMVIATLKHIDTILYENGAKTGDIKGLMIQMDPDEWDSRHGMAPIMVLHEKNKLSTEVRNILIREDYKFFPAYRYHHPKNVNTVDDYENCGMKEIYAE